MKKELIGIGLITSGLITISVGAYGLYKNCRSNDFTKSLEEEVKKLVHKPKEEEKKEE